MSKGAGGRCARQTRPFRHMRLVQSQGYHIGVGYALRAEGVLFRRDCALQAPQSLALLLCQPRGSLARAQEPRVLLPRQTRVAQGGMRGLRGTLGRGGKRRRCLLSCTRLDLSSRRRAVHPAGGD